MKAQDTKNREAADIPLHAELANDQRVWLEFTRTGLKQLENGGDVLPLRATGPKLKATDSLFDVPRQFVKILNRDLSAAGIAKADARGRTIDFHSLRHSFGTLLSTCGVTPRTAQQAMRHSTIDLTMNVCTDPRLLDVAGAMDSLPSLPLSNSLTRPGREPQQATGTDTRQSFVDPTVAPTVAPTLHFESIPDKMGSLVAVSKNDKTPQKTLFLRGLGSDADGTRTRNHWIDSPVL